ncbi:hypothetical protein AXA44_27625 [Rhodococcus sp. SC4]|nr:hypothetical protein AXA44_27625 [Rhodococcus sp. SC4]
MTLLLLTGVATDIQSVALSPLVGTMMADLGLSSSQVSWALNALLAGAAIGAGVVSRLGDLIGHRKVLLPVLFIGLLGCVLGALSTGFTMLVIGRFLMGVAVTTPLGWGMLRARASASTIQTAAVSLGTVVSIFTPLSLILGGVLVASGVGWQSVFWVSAVSYLAMLICVVVTSETPQSARPRVPLDWAGAVGLGIWLTAFLLAISEGPTSGWASSYVLSLWGIAAVVFVGWVLQQRRASAPLVDFRDMDLRQMGSGYVAISITVAVSYALYILLPAMLQMPAATGYGMGLTPLKASLPLIMIIPGSFIAAYFFKAWLESLGPRVPLVLGGLLTAAAFLGLTVLPDQLWVLYALVFVYGTGVVMCFNIGWALVAASGRQDNMSITFGVLMAVQFVAGAIANAVILSSLNLGATTLPTSGTFSTLYGGAAVVALLLFVLFGLLVAPKRLVDRHAVSE